MIRHMMPPPIQPMRFVGEPWLAAQNLTFLKHGSPEQKRKFIDDMPSLASSSEGTSPGEKKIDPDDDEGALLMAAVAMTEFGMSPSGRRPGVLETPESNPKKMKLFTTYDGVRGHESAVTKLFADTAITRQTESGGDVSLVLPVVGTKQQRKVSGECPTTTNKMEPDEHAVDQDTNDATRLRLAVV